MIVNARMMHSILKLNLLNLQKNEYYHLSGTLLSVFKYKKALFLITACILTKMKKSILRYIALICLK